jgi:hypothetical protein
MGTTRRATGRANRTVSVTQTSVNNLNQITATGAGGPLQFSGTLSKPAQVTVAVTTATPGNSYSTNFAGNVSVTTGTNTVPVIAHDVNGNTATNNYQVVIPTGSSATPTYDANGNLTNNCRGQTYTPITDGPIATNRSKPTAVRRRCGATARINAPVESCATKAAGRPSRCVCTQ